MKTKPSTAPGKSAQEKIDQQRLAGAALFMFGYAVGKEYDAGDLKIMASMLKEAGLETAWINHFADGPKKESA